MIKLKAIWAIITSRGFLLFTDDGFTTSAIPTDQPSKDAMIDSAEQYISFLERIEEVI